MSGSHQRQAFRSQRLSALKGAGSPYCRQAEPIVKQVRKVYGRNVRIVYMDFPLGFHPDAMEAALAARCAAY